MTWRLLGELGLVCMLGLAVYLPVLDHDFTNWDDDIYVTDNATIQRLSLSNLQTIFSRTYINAYTPLTLVSFAFEYQLVGLSPWLYHLDNVLLHLLNTLLAWRLIQRLTQRPRVAWVAAVLFVVHPLHVESVAWVTERKDVLFTCFFLLALLRYLDYVARPRWTTYVGALLLSVAALLAKGQAVTLPLVFVLIDWYQSRSCGLWASLVEKLPFFVVSVGFGSAGLMLMLGSTAGPGLPELGSLLGGVTLDRVVLGGYAYGLYIVKLLVPYTTSALYPEPPLWLAWLVGGLLAIAGLVLWRGPKVAREVWLGLGFWSVNILPVLQIVPLGEAYLADRFVYVGALGIFLIIGVVWEWGEQQAHWGRRWAMGIGLVYLVSLSVLTFQYTQVWKNSVTLWNDVIAKYDSLPVAYNNRGRAYAALGDCPAAMPDYHTAIRLQPYATRPYVNRAICWAQLGRLDRALGDLQRAAQLNPRSANVYKNRANVYVLQGQFVLALRDLQTAISLDPYDGMNFYNRGALWRRQGDIRRACQDFIAAARLGVPRAQQSVEAWCR